MPVLTRPSLPALGWLPLTAAAAHLGWRPRHGGPDRAAGLCRFIRIRPSTFWRDELLLRQAGDTLWRIERRVMARSHRTPRPAVWACQGEDPAALIQQATQCPRRRLCRWRSRWSVILGIEQGQVRWAEVRAGTTVAQLRAHATAADIRMWRAAHLPEDILALMGRAWSSLHGASPTLRRASVNVRDKGLAARATAMARHLDAALRRPPSRYHPDHWRSRWLAWTRRCAPLLLANCIPALALAAPWLQAQADTAWPALILALPLVALWACCLQLQAPRLEWAPWPRPLRPDGLTETRSATTRPTRDPRSGC